MLSALARFEATVFKRIDCAVMALEETWKTLNRLIDYSLARCRGQRAAHALEFFADKLGKNLILKGIFGNLCTLDIHINGISVDCRLGFLSELNGSMRHTSERQSQHELVC